VVGHLKQNLREAGELLPLALPEQGIRQDPRREFPRRPGVVPPVPRVLPRDPESPAINYQLAELLLEHKAFDAAAAEYERTAYAYAAHDKASAAGYAAVYAHRESAKIAAPAGRDRIRREVIRSSLKFVDTFPNTTRPPSCWRGRRRPVRNEGLRAGPDRGQRLITQYPAAEPALRRSAWIVWRTHRSTCRSTRTPRPATTMCCN